MNINSSLKLSIQSMYSFLFGILGGLCVFMIANYFNRPPQIAVVNVSSIVNEFVKKEANEKKEKKVVVKEVKQFGLLLEKNLKALAQEKHVILLPNEAVIAGAKNYTSLLKKKMNMSE